MTHKIKKIKRREGRSISVTNGKYFTKMEVTYIFMAGGSDDNGGRRRRRRLGVWFRRGGKRWQLKVEDAP